MRQGKCLILVTLVMLLGGCLTVKLGKKQDPLLEVDGIGNAYATFSALDDFDGTIAQIGLLGFGTRPGEILTLDIWPLGGIGVGLVGARVRVLPLEVAAGTLFYHPKPKRKSSSKTDPEEKPEKSKPGRAETHENREI